MPKTITDSAITQDHLAEYRKLNADYNSLGTKREWLRAKIIKAIEAGDCIEPGPLTATLSRQAAKGISRSKLAMMLGAAACDELFGQVAEWNYLTVSPAAAPTARATR